MVGSHALHIRIGSLAAATLLVATGCVEALPNGPSHANGASDLGPDLDSSVGDTGGHDVRAGDDVGDPPPTDFGHPDMGVADADFGAPDLEQRDASTDAGDDCSADTLAPVARWAMDAVTGGMVESSVMGAPAVNLNGESLVAGGKFGLAMRSINSRASLPFIPHDPVFELDEGSVSFWFRADAAALAQGTQAGLFSKDAQGASVDGHLHIFLQNGEVVLRQQGDSATTARQLLLQSGTAVTTAPNVWHHVLATWRVGQLELYLDGQRVAVDTTGGWSIATNREPIGLGFSTALSDEGSTEPPQQAFAGLIDEVAVFDKVLDAAAALDLQRGCGANVP
jgi:hypothetical protein